MRSSRCCVAEAHDGRMVKKPCRIEFRPIKCCRVEAANFSRTAALYLHDEIGVPARWLRASVDQSQLAEPRIRQLVDGSSEEFRRVAGGRRSCLHSFPQPRPDQSAGSSTLDDSVLGGNVRDTILLWRAASA